MTKYYIIKPATINLKARLKQFPPDFEFNIDYAHWLISEILIKTSYRLESEETEIWVPLSSQIMSKHPYKYRNHLRYLCENFPNVGNILWRTNYSKGKCYSYRLAPNFFIEHVELKEISDTKLLRYISKRIKNESNNPFKKQYNFLAKYFCPKKLKINVKSCNELNLHNYGIHYNYKKHITNAVSITQIANGEFKINLSENDGRVHTTLTRLPKQFRKFLTYEGKKLGEVDISASVPTFLLFILSNIDNNNKHIKNVINPSKIYYRHYMFQKSLLGVDKIELSSFKEKVLAGQFYDFFIDGMHSAHLYDTTLKKDQYYLDNVSKLFNREFDGDISDLREVIKKNFLSMLNAEHNQYINEQAEFYKHFPSILTWIKHLKKCNHKYFAYLTLQLESYFMLNIVARQLNKKYLGKITNFTLHDCIITTEDNLKLVNDFMEKTLTENLGFTPKMKMKLYQ